MGDNLFWDASVKELQQGFIWGEQDEAFTCLICGEKFVRGIVYPEDGVFYEARKAAEHHVGASHGSMSDYLLNMNKKYTGFTDHQREMAFYFQQGLTDKEIAKQVGTSPSTVRNHRFKLREKEKQARVFLAVMGLMKKHAWNQPEFVDIHKGAAMIDERYAITEKGKEKVLNTYFSAGLERLEQFPSKEKRKIIVLQHILTGFEGSRVYSEQEVNAILKAIYPDFATIRRYLIEYGFMDRSQDCTKYWVKS